MTTHTDPVVTAAADAEALMMHTYPGGTQPWGSTVITYCGLHITAAGFTLPSPPDDACPLCFLAWQSQRTTP